MSGVLDIPRKMNFCSLIFTIRVKILFFHVLSLSLSSLSLFFYFPLDEEFRLSDGGNVTTSVHR